MLRCATLWSAMECHTLQWYACVCYYASPRQRCGYIEINYDVKCSTEVVGIMVTTEAVQQIPDFSGVTEWLRPSVSNFVGSTRVGSNPVV